MTKREKMIKILKRKLPRLYEDTIRYKLSYLQVLRYLLSFILNNKGYYNLKVLRYCFRKICYVYFE